MNASYTALTSSAYAWINTWGTGRVDSVTGNINLQGLDWNPALQQFTARDSGFFALPNPGAEAIDPGFVLPVDPAAATVDPGFVLVPEANGADRSGVASELLPIPRLLGLEVLPMHQVAPKLQIGGNGNGRGFAALMKFAAAIIPAPQQLLRGLFFVQTQPGQAAKVFVETVDSGFIPVKQDEARKFAADWIAAHPDATGIHIVKDITIPTAWPKPDVQFNVTIKIEGNKILVGLPAWKKTIVPDNRSWFFRPSESSRTFWDVVPDWQPLFPSK